jgi:hypothetical protein
LLTGATVPFVGEGEGDGLGEGDGDGEGDGLDEALGDGEGLAVGVEPTTVPACISSNLLLEFSVC